MLRPRATVIMLIAIIISLVSTILCQIYKILRITDDNFNNNMFIFYSDAAHKILSIFIIRISIFSLHINNNYYFNFINYLNNNFFKVPR